MSSNGMKIDRLSQLPPELLYDIFDLAASPYQLCSVPSSKYLLPFHESALFRYLKWDSLPRSQCFAATFDKHQTKVKSLTTGSLSINLSYTPITYDLLKRIVPKLSLSQLELGPLTGIFSSALLAMMSRITVRSSWLRICSVSGSQSTTIFSWLRYFPSLRMVQLFDISFFEDICNSGARQVTQIAYTSPRTPRSSAYTSPLSILPYFPAATIVSLDLICFHPSEYDSLPSILDKLNSLLRILRLKAAFEPSSSLTKPLDGHLPRFSSLRELHLDATFLPHDYATDLLHLPLLVHLSLVLKDFHPAFLKLLEGPTRLRYLRRLSIEFGPIKVGNVVDLGEGLKESEGNRCIAGGRGLGLLERTLSFTHMYEWELPFRNEMRSDDEAVEALELAEKMERIAREMDVNVSTNLKAVRQAFHRQLVEYNNRGVAYLYLYWQNWLYDAALQLAKRLEINLPGLELDLKEKLEGGKLDWYKVRMEEAEVDGKGECYALNLRRKKE
ncbi:hypothetical protein JCM5353_001174 [Sporobolomyces roseus]